MSDYGTITKPAYLQKKKMRYQERKAKGMCARCSNVALSGYTICAKCRDEQNRRNREDFEFKKRLGLCRRCGGAIKDKRYCNCEDCRKKWREVYHGKKQLSNQSAT